MHKDKSQLSRGARPVAGAITGRQTSGIAGPASPVSPTLGGRFGISEAARPTLLQILTEDVITLNEAARELPTRTHLSTLYRWAKRGVNGRKLETVKVGSQIVTSRQALTRFLVALNDSS